MSHRTLAFLLRLSAVALTVAAVIVFFVQLRAAQAADTVSWLVLAVLVGVGLSLALAGLADVLANRDTDPASETARALARVQQQLTDMQRKVEDLGVAVDRMARNRAPAVPGAPAAPGHVTATLPPRALDPVMKALEEIRNIALLTDAERHERLTHMEQERKLMLVREALAHVEGRRWSEADHVVRTLEAEHPNDHEVKRTRQQFDDARRNAESDSVQRARMQVENFIGISSFEQAEQLARRLVEDFPGNLDAKGLLSRVTRERDIHRETSVARMVEEIRHDTERRLWRRALMHAQRLVEKFPDHPKTARVREQMTTLGENAEIEERQEQEVRIQELIRSRKFNEAIQLSEDLLMRFPTSPQAEAIEVLLPRIRELAKEEAEVSDSAA
jgi:outer membrane protein assembly factor BamD (BamD/ComL family)